MVQNESPSFTEVVNLLIDARLVDLHTSIPGVVVKYDAPSKTCDVQPTIKRRYIKNDEEVDLPVIPNVPMGFYQTSTSLISVPVKVGDDVLIIFSERSVDKWKAGQRKKSPEDVRKFHLADAMAYPVIRPLNDGVPAEAEPIYIKNILSEGRFHEDGQIKCENPICYEDLAANGDIEHKNASCTDTMENSGSITQKNAIVTREYTAAGNISVKNAISELSMSPIGLNDLKNALANITQSPDGTVIVKNLLASITITSIGAIIIQTPAGLTTVDQLGNISFGVSATDFILKGDAAAALYDGHTHVGVHGTTSPPSNSMTGALSVKVKTE